MRKLITCLCLCLLCIVGCEKEEKEKCDCDECPCELVRDAEPEMEGGSEDSDMGLDAGEMAGGQDVSGGEQPEEEPVLPVAGEMMPEEMPEDMEEGMDPEEEPQEGGQMEEDPEPEPEVDCEDCEGEGCDC